MSPQHMLRRRNPSGWLPGFLIVAYGLDRLAVTVASLTPMSIAYALQYFVYLALAYKLMYGYFAACASSGELNISYRIITVVFFVFAVGIVISVATGPFYPLQVLYSERMWGNFPIQQGVGFGDGTNGAGATMIIICSFFCFAYKKRNGRTPRLAALISVIALLVTISRGSILGFAFGVLSLCALLALRAVYLGKVTKKALKLAGAAFIIVALLAAGLNTVLARNSDGLVAVIAAGFGIGGTEILEREQGRYEDWQAGWSAWREGNLFFGKGFRNSQTVGDNGVWQTAHNFYLSALGDFGVFGLLLMLAAFAVFLKRVGKNILATSGSDAEKAAFVAIVGLLFHNVTEIFFYSPVLMTMVTMMFALPFGVSSRKVQG